MSGLDKSNEANEYMKKINALNSKSQEYTKLYNRLKDDVYNGSLRDMKTRTEHIYNGIVDSYNGDNKELFELAGQLNGNAQSMYQTLATLIYNKIQEINKQVKFFNNKIDSLK